MSLNKTPLDSERNLMLFSFILLLARTLGNQLSYWTCLAAFTWNMRIKVKCAVCLWWGQITALTVTPALYLTVSEIQETCSFCFEEEMSFREYGSVFRQQPQRERLLFHSNVIVFWSRCCHLLEWLPETPKMCFWAPNVNWTVTINQSHVFLQEDLGCYLVLMIRLFHN